MLWAGPAPRSVEPFPESQRHCTLPSTRGNKNRHGSGQISVIDCNRDGPGGVPCNTGLARHGHPPPIIDNQYPIPPSHSQPNHCAPQHFATSAPINGPSVAARCKGLRRLSFFSYINFFFLASSHDHPSLPPPTPSNIDPDTIHIRRATRGPLFGADMAKQMG